MRVPVRGQAVLHADAGPTHARVENVSRGGVLLELAVPPSGASGVEVELRLLGGGGFLTGTVVRATLIAGGCWHIALALRCADRTLEARIDAAIDAALSTVRQRPVLIVDDQPERRRALVDRLATLGLMPLAPATPLGAVDLLTDAALHVGVCMLAPGFRIPSRNLAAVLGDSFPWVTTGEIMDDLDATASLALDLWSASPIARLATG